MSRGPGQAPRRAVDVLFEHRGLALETTHLKALASPHGDRSNLRRALRTAVRRGLLQEWSEDGRRYYEFSFVGRILAVPLPPDDPARRPPGRSPEPSKTAGLSLKRETPWMIAKSSKGEA